MVGNKNIAPYKWLIYTSNSLLTTNADSLVSISALACCTDLMTYPISIWDDGYCENQENDAIVGVGFNKVENSVKRPSFNFQLSGFLVPDELNDYHDFLKVMRQRHKYFQELTGVDKSHPLTDAYNAIYCVTETNCEPEKGNRKVTIKAEAGKVYGL
jgi:hypothetical protein